MKTLKVIRDAVAAVWALLMLGAPIHAQAVGGDWTQIIAGSELSYLDLARRVSPDIQRVNDYYQGVLALPVRSAIDSGHRAISNYSYAVSGNGVVAFSNHGEPHVAMLFQPNTPDVVGNSVLAVFALAKGGRLVDLVNVSLDASTHFADPAVFALGHSNDGLLITSAHADETLNHRITALITVAGGKLAQMADVSTLSREGCAQESAFAPVPIEREATWAPFTIAVAELGPLEACGQSTNAPSSPRTVAATFWWNAASNRYEPDSNVLEKLFQETYNRFSTP